MHTLVKNGVIVTASNEFQADILITGEKITAIGRGLSGQGADRVIDAKGRYVLPGGVDNSARYEGPDAGGEDCSAGYEATVWALCGGTTTIVDSGYREAGRSLVDSIKHRLDARAGGKAVTDLAMHACCTAYTDEILAELPMLVDLGVTTMRMSMADKHTPLHTEDGQLFRTMQAAANNGMTLMVHAENGEIVEILRDQTFRQGCTAPKYHYMTRPAYGEAEAVSRAIVYARATGCPLCIAHVSCKEAVAVIAGARSRGAPVIAETCCHYLVLDRRKMDHPDFDMAARWVCSPPLREKEDQDRLWDALRWDKLSIVASDNAGISLRQKRRGAGDFRAIPGGAPGAGDRLNILWAYGVEAGRISRQRLVAVYATEPAKLNGIYPRKGTIDIGSDADLTIWDSNYRGTITAQRNPTGVEYNIFEGLRQKGRVETVLLRGNVVVEGAAYVGCAGGGEFIPGEPFGSAYALLSR